MAGGNALAGLLLIYAAVLVINVVLSGFLWARYRTPLNKSLFLAWAFSVLSFALQGIPTTRPTGMVLGFLSAFPVSLVLANLLAGVLDLTSRWRIYLITLGGAVVCLGVASALGLPFWAIALAPAVAVAFPLFHVAFRAFRHKSAEMSTTAKAAAVTCVVFGLNHLDYPFMRDKPQLALIGFSLALLVIFASSITFPAIVLERVAGERAKIEQLGQLRSRFFANVSHELRTPLTMILAPLEGLLAEEFGPLNANQKAYLRANQRNALRLLRLINDLLDLAKKEDGFLRLRPEKTDLCDLLEEVVTYARPLAARKQLSLELKILNRPQDLHVEIEKIERVLVNLVSNALKFTSQGGVTVSMDSKDGVTEIVVADTGIGIAPEGVARLFERFAQADKSIGRRFGGTGIGLAYAKEIVNLHGGELKVESTLGQGSRFIVRLREGADAIPEEIRDRRTSQTVTVGEQPEMRRQEDQEPREWALRLQGQEAYRFSDLGEGGERRAVERGQPPVQSARILLVEDHADILELVHLQLRDQYQVYVAQNGRLGLELARKERPDLIITDYMMPEMDGLAMVRELRGDGAFAETPIIMLTAKSQLDDRLEVRNAGVDVYLGKPFSPRELEAAVRSMLVKRGRHVASLMHAHAEGLEIVSGGLAHEIQNPLTFIKGAQLMIAEQLGKIRDQIAGAALTDPARVAAIDRSKQKIDRMVNSANEGVSRIEGVVALLRRYAREGYPKEASEVPFDQAIKEVVQLVAPPIDAETHVELDLQAPEGYIRCIPEEFNQVVRCLVQNAVEALGTKGTVKVKSRSEGKVHVLEVTDNGPGIAPDQVTKIFSPFFTTKAGTGRGLGLAIAQLVVSRAGGNIEVSSTQNVETTFRVRLPAAFLGDGVPLPRERERESASLGH
jgi:signal transduction histidine kinase